MSAREILAQEWRQRLDDFAASEMTVQDWCDFNRVTPDRYYYWRRRLANEQTQPHTPCFVPVDLAETPAAPSPSSAITVRLAGAEIDVRTGFDPALLRAVVAALATSPC